MQTLEEKLGYHFQNIALLENALTHSSYANEHKAAGLESNERLEFLGDSVLGMVVADYLYRHCPTLPEGDLGKGEELGGGRTRASIQADAVESVLAAVYLDGGISAARRLIQHFILNHISRVHDAAKDHKTALQEIVQRKSGQQLTYALVGESGPDHAKTFRMEVCLNGEPIGTGEGHSKKEAEQAAAAAAIRALEQEKK